MISMTAANKARPMPNADTRLTLGRRNVNAEADADAMAMPTRWRCRRDGDADADPMLMSM